VEVHHTEYPAVLGEEPLTTLRALCAPCHRAAHGPQAGTIVAGSWGRVVGPGRGSVVILGKRRR
jgi:hypothetical protein